MTLACGIYGALGCGPGIELFLVPAGVILVGGAVVAALVTTILLRAS